jgi:hypothetical protein
MPLIDTPYFNEHYDYRRNNPNVADAPPTVPGGGGQSQASKNTGGDGDVIPYPDTWEDGIGPPGTVPPGAPDPGDGAVPGGPNDVVVDPPPGGGGGQKPIWDTIGETDEPFQFDTRAPDPGNVPQFPWFTGDGGPNVVTQPNGDNVYDVYEQMNPGSGILTVGGQMTQINPDGSITPGDINPTIRQVIPGEMVSEQLHHLLSSDSKFIKDARRQGLEQANAQGGLGGTVGIGASIQAAIRTGLPIAQADAEAFRAAASQNMQALNQFSQLNHQRTTQLELAQVDSRTKQLVTQIGTSAQMAAAQLQSATQRDLARLGAEVQLRSQEMAGQIQNRLANIAFVHNALLNDAQYAADLAKTTLTGEYGLANTGLAGMWNEKAVAAQTAAEKEATYVNAMTGAYDGYLNRLSELNGIEMDDAARQRAIATITDGFRAMTSLIGKLFPDVEPIDFNLGG